MPSINIIAENGTKTEETFEVSEKLFNSKKNPVVVREVLNQYLANQRQGTLSTKTRGEVSGGGKKPWRQKGTGRARHGSIRSPIWRHGGIVFGPKPRDFSYTIPKKKKRLAFYTVLTAKREEDKIKLVKEIPVQEPKTKLLVNFLTSLGVAEEKNLILLDKVNPPVYLAGRNIPGVKVSIVDNINIYDLLYYDNLIATPESIKRLEELIG
ncbi:MAG: 50S ribosomal protein L4 [Candidatus Sumerlaeia bacterium]|nr:50S ribosomal protein L4 [Candidatus Sumerlaeia bacterium]